MSGPRGDISGLIGKHAGMFVPAPEIDQEAEIAPDWRRTRDAPIIPPGQMTGMGGDISGLMQAQMPQMPQAPQNLAQTSQTPAQMPQMPQISQPQGAFGEAVQSLNLTPQEQFLYQHHLKNVMGPGGFEQPGGDYSSVLQVNVQGPDGRFYNIPTVWFGQQLPVPIARVMAAEAGWDKWPAYVDAGEAERRYNDMHEYMSRDIALIGR